MFESTTMIMFEPIDTCDFAKTRAAYEKIILQYKSTKKAPISP